ncbi:MAG: hypothetical protein GX096_05970 [Clostridiales bacterium]|nr:hypothetical protein [Clostridiales bacterium]
MANKNNMGYKYDAITNTLIMTASFAKKAGQLASAEYHIMKQLRTDNPNMTIETKTNSSKRSHTGIKFSAMENYMSKCRNAQEYLRMFQTVRALSKGQSSPYQYVCEWFNANFPNFSKQPILDADGYIIVDAQVEATSAILPMATSGSEDSLAG